MILLSACLVTLSHNGFALTEPQEGALVDMIVASVDDFPIALSDIQARMRDTEVTPKVLASDMQSKKVLQQLILENLIRAEAKNYQISVSSNEVDTYIQQVAERNDLTTSEFQAALKEQGAVVGEYRNQVELEVLRSRLVGRLMEGVSGVQTSDVDQYLEDHPELMSPGTKLVLRQIFIASSDKEMNAFSTKVTEVEAALGSGKDFAEVAALLSEGSEAEEGGSLGIVAVTDLHPTIQEALKDLEPGANSEAVTTPIGVHFFSLERKFNVDDEEFDTLRDEVRKIVELQQRERKLQEYFASDIFKNHSVVVLAGAGQPAAQTASP